MQHHSKLTAGTQGTKGSRAVRQFGSGHLWVNGKCIKHHKLGIDCKHYLTIRGVGQGCRMFALHAVAAYLLYRVVAAAEL